MEPEATSEEIGQEKEWTVSLSIEVNARTPDDAARAADEVLIQHPSFDTRLYRVVESTPSSHLIKVPVRPEVRPEDLFALDVEKARAFLATEDGEGVRSIGLESPARDIESLLTDVERAGAITNAPALELVVYPLRFEDDPDALLVAIRPSQPPYLSPLWNVSTFTTDWDDIIDSEAVRSDDPLTIDQAIEGLQEILRLANELVPMARAAMWQPVERLG